MIKSRILINLYGYARGLLDKLDIQWQLKKIIYRADVARFNEILNNNNVKYSIDILKDHGAFRRELLGPLHPDKVGNSKDFLFINALREKFKADINVQEVAQEFLYKTTTGFKILNTVVDSARLMRTPTQDNMKKVLLDSAQLYGLYSRVNFYSTAINAIDAAHYLYLGQYEKAAEHIMTTVGLYGAALYYRTVWYATH